MAATSISGSSATWSRPDPRGPAPATRPEARPLTPFTELAHAFLADEYEASPVTASHLGVDGSDDRLDDLSESAFVARRRRSTEWLARFRAVGEAALGADDRLDRDLLVSILGVLHRGLGALRRADDA